MRKTIFWVIEISSITDQSRNLLQSKSNQLIFLVSNIDTISSEKSWYYWWRHHKIIKLGEIIINSFLNLIFIFQMLSQLSLSLLGIKPNILFQMTEKLKAILLKRPQSGNTKFKFRPFFFLPLPYFVQVISVGNSEISKTSCYLNNISPCYCKLHPKKRPLGSLFVNSKSLCNCEREEQINKQIACSTHTYLCC